MASEQIQKALDRLRVVMQLRGASAAVSSALARAVADLETAVTDPSAAERRRGLRAGIAELWSCLEIIRAENREANRELLDGTTQALAPLLPLQLATATASEAGAAQNAAALPPPVAAVPAPPPLERPDDLDRPPPQFVSRRLEPAAREPVAAPPPTGPPPAVAAALAATDLVLWDVVQEHLDESEFLLEQWLAAARSPRFSLEVLQRTLEPRLLAHLDGLVAGGPAVADRAIWRVLADDAEADEPQRRAAALTVLADAETPPQRLVAILGGTGDAKVRAAICAAFQLSARPDIAEASRLALYEIDSAPVQRALLAILSARRIDPGPIMVRLLDSTDEEVLCAALSAIAAVVGDRDRHRQVVEACLFHASPAVCAAALRTGLIWNLESARRACSEQALSGVPQAMLYWVLVGGAAALPTLIAALSSPAQRKSALFALGFTGRLAAVEAVLPWLEDPDPAVARLAVEAIAGITGLPLYDEAYAAPPPADGPDETDAGGAAADQGELPPLEADLATDLMPSPADLLPVPAASPIRAWWADRRSSFAPDRRYLNGEPLSQVSLQDALAGGPLRRSGPLAYEIAVRTGGKTQIQALRLAQPRVAVPVDVQAAFEREPQWR